LIQRIERHVADLGHEALDLYTNIVMTANIGWYGKLGFVETGRAKEDGFHRIYMRKTMADINPDARSPIAADQSHA
jgi:ribosomal protein S18 acetylase RimI-like enzyme